MTHARERPGRPRKIDAAERKVGVGLSELGMQLRQAAVELRGSIDVDEEDNPSEEKILRLATTCASSRRVREVERHD